MRLQNDGPATTPSSSEPMSKGAWRQYDIHGLVRIRTNGGDLDFPNYFRTETDEPNYEIRLVDKIDTPTLDDARRVGSGTCAFGDGELLYECDIPVLHLAGARRGWKTLIRGLDREETVIATALPFFRAGPLRAVTVPMLSRLVRLVLTLKLLQHGLAPFYASSVANNGDASLVFGYSWTGKSTVVGEMIRRGMHFMSDDYSIADGTGRVYCYPDWHASHTSRPNMPILKYLRLTAPAFRKARDRVFKVAREARIQSIFFLERGPDKVVDLDREEAARRISLINVEQLSKLWNSPLSLIVSYYSYFYPSFDLFRLAERHRSIAESLVDRAERCTIIRSESPRFEIAERLLSDSPRGAST